MLLLKTNYTEVIGIISFIFEDIMQLVNEKISLEILEDMSKKMFGGIVKAVVDIEKKIMVVDADMHVDQEFFLLENGSLQKNLWGINFHPAEKNKSFVEFDSMINLRPSQDNCSRGVDSPEIQKVILSIVNGLVKK